MVTVSNLQNTVCHWNHQKLNCSEKHIGRKEGGKEERKGGREGRREGGREGAGRRGGREAERKKEPMFIWLEQAFKRYDFSQEQMPAQFRCWKPQQLAQTSLCLEGTSTGPQHSCCQINDSESQRPELGWAGVCRQQPGCLCLLELKLL